MCVKNVINVTVKALGKRMFGEPKYNKGILLNDSTYICLLIGFLFFKLKWLNLRDPHRRAIKSQEDFTGKFKHTESNH